jgi:hypothetical protein
VSTCWLRNRAEGILHPSCRLMNSSEAFSHTPSSERMMVSASECLIARCMARIVRVEELVPTKAFGYLSLLLGPVGVRLWRGVLFLACPARE